MSEVLSCAVLSWAELAEHEAELLPARTVMSCGGGGHFDGNGGGDGDGGSSGGDFNLNENTNTNTNTATATATLIPEGGLLTALLG